MRQSIILNFSQLINTGFIHEFYRGDSFWGFTVPCRHWGMGWHGIFHCLAFRMVRLPSPKPSLIQKHVENFPPSLHYSPLFPNIFLETPSLPSLLFFSTLSLFISFNTEMGLNPPIFSPNWRRTLTLTFIVFFIAN